MEKRKETLVEKYWRIINNNKILSIIIVLGLIIITIGTFTDSLQKLKQFAVELTSHKQHNDYTVLKKPGSWSTFKGYNNSNIIVSEDNINDIVTLSKDNIVIDFSLNNKEINLTYVLKNKSDYLEISPYNEHLNLLKHGGPISTVHYYWQPIDFQFPTLDFKIVNNSDNVVFFTKAILNVSSSNPDLFPIIFIPTEYQMYFQLRNAGWGKVYNCSMRFNLFPEDSITKDDSGYQFEALIGEFEDLVTLDLARFFKVCGVDTAVIKEYYRNSKERFLFGLGYLDKNYTSKVYPEGDHRNLMSNALGPFKNGICKISGELHYGGLNDSNRIVKEKVRFESIINIGLFGPGAPFPPSSIYDVKLELDKKNYIKEVPISQVLKPGEADRFDLKLYTSKSSRHQFKLTLFYNNTKNNQFTFPHIFLKYFKPKPNFWAAGLPDTLSYIQKESTKIEK